MLFNKRSRPNQRPKRGAPMWMTTYSDMMTLILVFFILLYAFSEVDISKFKAISYSFENRPIFEYRSSVIPMEYNMSVPGRQQGKGVMEQDRNEDIERLGQEALRNQQRLNEVLRVVNQFLESNHMQHAVSATRDERGIVLVLQDRVLFNSGEAEILDGALPFLNKVADLIEALPNQVEIQGHTDNVPISSFRYPSNWELSTARASRVVRYFVEEKGLDPSRFVAVGYGEYKPVASNDTEAGRQKNRRVEIVINNLEEPE
ncbi:MAG: flagellar motor protein MotB [Bacillaceae bacterium]|nr:flagellar motor protein MotB [Bacillaceae bacterium]